MCGIYGFQAREEAGLSVYEKAIMGLTLASEMEHRGRDSFGGLVFRNQEPEVIKGLGKVTEKGADLLRRIAEANKVLCHTRAATVGAVSIPNAHPFTVGDVTGVHNGGISNHKELNSKYNRAFEVDSQHIFAHINDGLDLTDLEGYGTVFFTRESEGYNRIYFFKSTAGSLTLARLYRGSCIANEDPEHFAVVWASEYSAIRACTERIGCQMHSVSIDANKLYYIQDGEAYNIDKQEELQKIKWELSYKPRSSGGVVYDFRNHNTGDSKSTPFVSSKPSRDMVIYSATGYSRKERKAIRKAEKAFRANPEAWSSCTADPLPETLVKVDTMCKVFKHSSAGTTTAPLCISCACDLDEHKWGMCKNNRRLHLCKSTVGVPCKPPSNGLAKMCRECGHYLVEGIHRVSEATETLWCVICSTYCLPEVELTDAEQSLLLEHQKLDEGDVTDLDDDDDADDDESPTAPSPAQAILEAWNDPDGDMLGMLD